jgi:hypothetical protein
VRPAVTVSLWVLAIVCFYRSWASGDGRLAGAGATVLVIYIVMAARLRAR